MADFVWLVAFSLLLFSVHSLPTGLQEESKKTDQPARPKGTLSNSGLDDTISDISQQPEPKALPSTYLTDQLSAVPQHERNYEYGKVLVTAETEDAPQPQQQQQLRARAWNLPLSRFYGDDRRKRSEDSSSSTPAPPSSSSAPQQQQQQQQAPTPASRVPAAGAAETPISYGLAKPSSYAHHNLAYRSYLPYYQEPRYKRESDIDPETFLALLELYDERRNNRDDWRNYGIEEYEPADDDSNMLGNDDEDPRVLFPQPHRYYSNDDPLLSSELLGRGRSSYYDQFLTQQQQQQQQQYGTPQYGLPQQSAYYPLEKRFMTRKRSQNYDLYNGGRNGYVLNTRGYPNYQQRILY